MLTYADVCLLTLTYAGVMSVHAAADAKSAVLANVVLLDAQVEALFKALLRLY
jgi:hypothetical protein